MQSHVHGKVMARYDIGLCHRKGHDQQLHIFKLQLCRPPDILCARLNNKNYQEKGV